MRGTTLGDRYRLDEWLGGGSMGDVWLARDQVLDRRVAVKVLKPALLDEPGFAERFHDEARVMARVQHPGIVGVYDFGPGRTADDVPSWGAPQAPAAHPVAYLVMELIEGEPLSAVLERRGPLTVPESLGLALEVLAALQAAHEAGIVHRDVKPANLMIRGDGQVVVTDFGIARPGCDPRLTVPGMVLGTAAYQAPEQASTGTVTASADLYALGVVLYECLSGRLPFEGETALELILKHLTDPVPPLPDDVPAPVRALVERALAKDPALRWPDAAAMGAAVVAALAGESVEGPAGGPSWAAVVRSTGALAALRSTGSAARPVVAAGGGDGGGAAAPSPRRTGGWRAALFGSRRRTLLVAGATALCCAATATAALVLHRPGEPVRSRTADVAVSGVPLTAPVGLLPEAGAPSPSPDAPTASGAPSPTGPVVPGAPLPEGGTVGGGAVGGGEIPGGGTVGGGGAPGGPTGRDGAAPGFPANPPAAAPAPGGPDAPAGSPAPGGPAVPSGPSPAPGQPSTPGGPVYTAAPPPPSVPAYTAAPSRTVPPAPDYTYAPKPTYTASPPPYTASPPPPPPPGTIPTDPPIKPPTQPGQPMPPLARLSNGGAVLYDQASLDRPGNPVVLSSDDGGPGGVWQLTPYTEGGYALSNGATEYSKVLNLEEARAQTQLASRPAPPATAATQVWSFFPVPGGYVVTVARDSRRCLSAVGPGVPATVRTCAGTADQVWTVSAA
ncbi:serine/threonine protein kinase [Kitasatospora sp. NPDC057541]|uniref:serine/threonine protein kinase n=1 Tax=unclassified Kitasatospora TaxID=2633591 RepID=UPI003681372C